MTLEAIVDSEYENLKMYFEKKFELLKEYEILESNIKPEVYNADARSIPICYNKISHFIKPDMIINIYSFLEYELRNICKYHSKETLELSKTNGDNELQIAWRCLKKVIDSDISNLECKYNNLQNLRVIRNIFIHNGGYIEENDKYFKQISNLKYISIGFSGLVNIHQEYIFDILLQTSQFLKELYSK